MDTLFGCLVIDYVKCSVRGRLHPLHWPNTVWNIVRYSMSHPLGGGKQPDYSEAQGSVIRISERVQGSGGNPELISVHLSI